MKNLNKIHRNCIVSNLYFYAHNANEFDLCYKNMSFKIIYGVCKKYEKANIKNFNKLNGRRTDIDISNSFLEDQDIYYGQKRWLLQAEEQVEV